MDFLAFDFFTLFLIILLGLLFPLLGIWDFRRLARWTESGLPDARVKTYKLNIITQWVVTAGLLLWWLYSGKGLRPLGIEPHAQGWQWLPIFLGLAGIVFLFFQMHKVMQGTDDLAKLKESMGNLGLLAPRSPQEERLFTLLSITAGICEEILYRGLLAAVFVPLIGMWPTLVLVALFFGLAHAYQGVSGIAKTAFVGLVLGLLATFSGSLYIAILLHSVVDITSGRMMGAVMQMEKKALQ